MLISHNKPHFGPETAKAAQAVMESGFLGCGEKTKQLEKKWCEITQSDQSAAVSSGTSALRLALQALEVGPGDECIIPAYSCTSLFSAVLNCGATPVLADIKPDLTVDRVSVEKKITDETKAIIAIHLFGCYADIDTLLDYDIPVVEDFSHGIFTQRGTLGIASHGPTKFINSCSGGIVSGGKELIEKIRDLRDYCDKAPSTKQNDMPNDLAASIALEQLSRLSDIRGIRLRLAERYEEMLLGVPIQSHQNPVYPYRFIVRIANAKQVSAKIQKLGIMAYDDVVWDYRATVDWPNDLPNCDNAFEEILSLPFYLGITKEDQKTVVELLGECLK